MIQEGDIVSVDTVALKNGFHGDAARTFLVGKVSNEAKRLVEVTKQAFFEGIKFAKPGFRICPDEEDDGFDPQVFAAMQTRFIVDVQEGTSMIFFLNQEKYEDYKDEGVFPANAEDYTSIQDCQGYKEAGSPQSAGEYMVALRIIDESSGLSEDEEIQDYYTANEKLLREFIGE